MNRWPAPTPGDHLTLPVLGSLIQLHLPPAGDHTQYQETVTCSGAAVTASLSTSTELATVLFPLLEHLHILWELVLTAQPLVVQAASPSQCSATVQALTSIIHPLTFLADYRPFYTIHDVDFKELTSSNSSALPSIILGVTNPFFNKVKYILILQLMCSSTILLFQLQGKSLLTDYLYSISGSSALAKSHQTYGSIG